jgi:hypothetical protein
MNIGDINNNLINYSTYIKSIIDKLNSENNINININNLNEINYNLIEPEWFKSLDENIKKDVVNTIHNCYLKEAVKSLYDSNNNNNNEKRPNKKLRSE